MSQSFPEHIWWEQLEPQWKNAFAEVFFKHNDQPTPKELVDLFNSPAIRFAGPTAAYPNMSFELTNLSGISRLTNLETLVVAHHRIETITELSFLTRLVSLFLFNNQIKSLEGINDLTSLRMLYVQCNRIESLEPLRKLTSLQDVYVNSNLINSLEGLTEEHSEKLEKFYCKPNEGLKQKELLRVERELGIRCSSL